MKVGTLEIELLANMARLQGDMDKATSAVERGAAKMESALGFAAKAFAALGVAAIAADFARGLKGAIDMADKLDDLAEKSGVAVKALSALRYAGEVTGTPLEALATGIRKLSINMIEAAGGAKEQTAVFAAMGVSVKDAEGKVRSADAMLGAIADKFKTYADGPEKAALAVQVFGKAGADMIPLLNQGADGIESLRKEADALGVTMGADFAREAATFNDNLKKIELAAEGSKNAILGELLPSLNVLLEKFIEGKKEGSSFGEVIGGLLKNELVQMSILVNGVSTSMTRLVAIAGAARDIFNTPVGNMFAGTAAVMDGLSKKMQQLTQEQKQFQVSVRAGVSLTADRNGSAGKDPRRTDFVAEGPKGAAPVVSAAAKTGGGASTDDSLAIIKRIQERIDLDKEQLAVGRQLTDFEKFSIKVNNDAATSKHGITAAARGRIAAMLKESEVAGVQAAVQKSQADEAKRISDERAAARKADYEAVEKYIAGETDRVNAGNAVVKGMEDELALLRMSNIDRVAAVGIRQLEAAGIDRTSESYRVLTERIRAAAAAQQEEKDLQAARETLRTELDPAKAQDFGAALSGSLGTAGSAMQKLVGSMDKYVKATAQIGALEKQNAKIKVAAAKAFDAGDLAKGEELMGEHIRNNAELEERRTRATIEGYADAAGSAKMFFEEGSTGYKTLQAAENAFRLYQLASDVVKGVSAAAVAIANQATSGDPYTAIPRMIAMAGVMAALGFAVGGMGGGGGGRVDARARQEAQGSGSVLGDSKAKSESLSRSLEMLRDSAKIELTYQSGMLAALRNIEASFGALGSLIVRVTGLNGKYTGSTDMRTTNNSAAGTSGLLSGIWGKNTKKLVDQGISFTPSSLAGIQAGYNVGARGYSDIETTKSSFFGLSKKVTTNRELSVLDQKVVDQFNKIIISMADSAKFAAGALGISGAEFDKRLEGFIVDLGDISFKDMNGKQIEEALQNVFSKLGDDIMSQVLPEMKAYQKVGEGLYETTIRVASSIESAGYALEKFGITAINYKDIVNKQGDSGVEIFRQSVALMEAPGSKLVTILNGVDGKLDDVAAVFGTLLEVRDLMRNVGSAALDLSQAMLRGAGGLEKLKSGLEDYFDKFFTDEEKLAANTARLNEEFKRSGLVMPKSKEEFRRMVEGIDTSTDAGAKLYGKLVSLSGAFADVADSAEEATRAAKEQADAALTAATDAAMAAMEKAFEEQKKMLQAQREIVASAVSGLKAVLDVVRNAVRDIYNEVAPTKAAAAANGLAFIATTLASVRAGGVAPDSKKLQDSITAARGGIQNGPLTQLDADFQRLSLAGQLKALEDVMGPQLSEAERQLAALDKQIEQNEAMLAYWKEAVEMARNGWLATKDVRQAVWDLAVALEKEKPGTIGRLTAANNGTAAGGNATPGTGAGSPFVIGGGNNAQAQALARRPKMGDANAGIFFADGLNFDLIKFANENYNPFVVRDKLKSLGIGLDAAEANLPVEFNIRKWMTDAGVPAFMAGGDHSGGWARVGENGPENVWMPPARVYSAGSSATMDTGIDRVAQKLDAVVAELSELKATARRQEVLLDDVTEGGNQMRTKVAA